MTDSTNPPDTLALNVAIVGGGRTCKFFLELLKEELFFKYLNVAIVGVCDINPAAEGFCMAKEMGIYTTDNVRDLLKRKPLDRIIDLTGSDEVEAALSGNAPEAAGLVEQSIGKLFSNLFKIDQTLKSAEQQVALEKMVSDFLIHQSNERIVVIRPDFTIIDANALYLEAVGKPIHDAIGAHCYEITHGLNSPCSTIHPEMGCPLEETLRTGRSAQVIHDHPSTSGESSYCNLITFPVKNQNGEIVRVIEIWRDITEELSSRWESRVKALKDDLNKLVQEDRMISLGKLVASCVHEINNPIQGLLTFSHLMKDTLEEGSLSIEDHQKFRHYLSIMAGELERCGAIISGLLSFSRQSDIEDKEVDLNEILHAVTALTKHKMDLQNIQLDLNLSDVPLLVRGDLNQLQQSFLNLIFNAIEAMPEGGKLRVAFQPEDMRGQCRIAIEDTGYGIHPDHLDHIFDPFFTTKSAGQGTGLGLSIVYGIVHNHGGDIKVESRPGQGTRFLLTFPTVSSR